MANTESHESLDIYVRLPPDVVVRFYAYGASIHVRLNSTIALSLIERGLDAVDGAATTTQPRKRRKVG